MNSICYSSGPKFGIMFLKEVSYAHRVWIYLIKNTVILWTFCDFCVSSLNVGSEDPCRSRWVLCMSAGGWNWSPGCKRQARPGDPEGQEAASRSFGGAGATSWSSETCWTPVAGSSWERALAREKKHRAWHLPRRATHQGVFKYKSLKLVCI